MSRISLLFLLLVFCSVAPAAYADPILLNGSFEQGFAGWTLSNPLWLSNPESCCAGQIRPVGFTEIHTSFERPAGSGSLLGPKGGLQFAEISTGANYVAPGFPGPINVTASQNVALAAGDLLSGWSAFFSGDNHLEDFAWVRIFDANGIMLATPWAEHSGTPGYDAGAAAFGQVTGWTQWTWQAQQAGIYTLMLGETSIGDNQLLSQAFHDDIRATPEPASFSLLAIGLASFAAARRRRRSRV